MDFILFSGQLCPQTSFTIDANDSYATTQLLDFSSQSPLSLVIEKGLVENSPVKTVATENSGQSDLHPSDPGYLHANMWEKMFASCVGDTVLEISRQDCEGSSPDQETSITSTEVAMLNSDRCEMELATKTINHTKKSYSKSPRRTSPVW